MLAVGFCFIVLLLVKDSTNPLFWSLTLFFVSLNVVSSLMVSSDGAPSEIIFDTAKQVGFCALAIYGLGRYPRDCIAAFVVAGLVACSLNYVTYIVYYDVPGGMQAGTINSFGRQTAQHWFYFGSDNASLEYSLPVAAALIYYTITYNTKWIIPTVIFSVVTLQMYIRLDSVNATITFVFIAICALYALYKMKTESKLSINRNSVIVVAIGFNLLVILVFNTESMAAYIEQLFGKSSSFLARTDIWDNAIFYFQESPLFGQGVSNDITDILRLTYNHAHNVILQILYQGGLLALFLFIVVMYICMRNKSCNHDLGGFIIACSIGAVFIGGTFEFHFTYVPQFFCLILLHFINLSGQKKPSHILQDNRGLVRNKFVSK